MNQEDAGDLLPAISIRRGGLQYPDPPTQEEIDAHDRRAMIKARICPVCAGHRLGWLAWRIYGICKGCRLRRSMS